MDAFLLFLANVGHTYLSFFYWSTWVEVFDTPASWVQVLMLAGLEGLLSADNALVLAVMVSILPLEQRKKALLYGFWGAVLFRFIFIGLGNYLISIEWIKYLGAAYLMYLWLGHFLKGKEDENHNDIDDNLERKFFLIRWLGYVKIAISTQFAKLIGLVGTFWFMVVKVELTDLSFSVDSILASLAFSNKVGILLLGGVFGILAMRFVSSIFLKLLEQVPIMEHTAYILIGMISVKMAISSWYELNQWLFFAILIGTFLATFVVNKFVRKEDQGVAM